MMTMHEAVSMERRTFYASRINVKAFGGFECMVIIVVLGINILIIYAKIKLIVGFCSTAETAEENFIMWLASRPNYFLSPGWFLVIRNYMTYKNYTIFRFLVGFYTARVLFLHFPNASGFHSSFTKSHEKNVYTSTKWNKEFVVLCIDKLWLHQPRYIINPHILGIRTFRAGILLFERYISIHHAICVSSGIYVQTLGRPSPKNIEKDRKSISRTPQDTW